jgi:GNAT superfamily N-acetyltransferase
LTTAIARTGPLSPHHRQRIHEILVATRVFRSEEVDVAIELFDETFPLVRAAGGESSERTNDEAPREPLAHDDAPSLSSPSSYCFLGAFTPEDELTGFACYGPTPGTDRTFDLYWIAVHPSAQGTGSGTILLSEVERRLEDTDARLFVVETSSRPEYEPTRAFYRARGYAEAACMRDFYAPSDHRVIFTKRFHQPHRGQGAASR